jgi:hypothetical protein
VGRPYGTSESIESLAKKDTQANLKMSERLRRSIDIQLGRIEKRLHELDPSKDLKEIIELTEFLHRMREGVGRMVRDNAKIAMADPAKASEGEGDAGAKELLAQLKGDG